MKKSILIFTSVFLLSIIFGCEKIPFDFRNKYVGDYEFEYSYSSWQINIGVYETDTINYSGKVYYDEKGKIKINYNPNLTLDLDIDKNGTLSLECGAEIGEFDDDENLTLNYSSNSCGSNGLGRGTNYKIIGTKK